MIKHFWPGLLCLLFLWLSCQPDRTDRLTIATAANMQFAMEALMESFTAETGIACEIVISSSGKLTAQIEEGAPFDIFVSADTAYPSRLFRAGLTTGEPQIYAFGKLVLWTMLDHLEPSPDLLRDPRIRHIALANPQTAPYGAAALEVLKHHGMPEALKGKLVYGESIAQTNQFIISRAAEIGFTAKSVVLSPQMAGKGRWIDVDPEIYQPIAQGVVILKTAGAQMEMGKAFQAFLFSTRGQEALERFGYAAGRVN